MRIDFPFLPYGPLSPIAAPPLSSPSKQQKAAAITLTPTLRASLLNQARRHARRIEEAEDLVQTALLVALEAGRADFSDPANQRWLTGVIRKRAAFEARSAVRRKTRETTRASDAPPTSDKTMTNTETDTTLDGLLNDLSPALRLTAQLALNGCTREEIKWLLGLSNTALRQRISQLKRAFANADQTAASMLKGDLAFGEIRRVLIGAVRRPSALMASHDPDGHLFLISRSQNLPSRQQPHEQAKRS